jgi:hypothetical protein
MYYLSIGAIFKNESHCLKEWIDHYIFHGVNHFYLINDDSDDNYFTILEPYINKGYVTLFNAKWDRYKLRQTDMYCHYILPNLKNTKWLLMIDLDEFVWSPKEIDLKKILIQCEHLCQLQIEHTLFGSNCHIEQPKSLVAAFTKRNADQPSRNPGSYKYFVNSDFPVLYLNVHHATQENKEDELKRFKIIGPEWFIMNHYCCQSRNFWNNVKCKRGDVDEYTIRCEEDLEKIDFNDLEDTRLLEQNRSIIE